MNSIKSSIINIQGQIVSNIDDANGKIDNIDQQVSNARSSVIDYQHQGQTYDGYRCDFVLFVICCMVFVCLLICSCAVQA